MTTPTRWKDVPPREPELARAAQLVTQDQQTPATWHPEAEQQFWAALPARLSRRRRAVHGWTLGALAAPACALALALMLRPGERRAPVVPSAVQVTSGAAERSPVGAPPAALVASPGAHYRRSARGLELERGRVEGALRGSLRTVELELFSAAARVAVDRTELGTRVRVFEGEVVARDRDGRASSLRGGTDRFFAAQAWCPPSLARPARRACLEELARGEGLAAQNALFLLALLDGEPKAFERYLSRFPQGPHASEARRRAAQPAMEGSEPERDVEAGRWK